MRIGLHTFPAWIVARLLMLTWRKFLATTVACYGAHDQRSFVAAHTRAHVLGVALVVAQVAPCVAGESMPTPNAGGWSVVLAVV